MLRTNLLIAGLEKPKEIVVVSGHIDSWDVGQGAMDDAGPCFVALQTLLAVKALNLRYLKKLLVYLKSLSQYLTSLQTLFGCQGSRPAVP